MWLAKERTPGAFNSEPVMLLSSRFYHLRVGRAVQRELVSVLQRMVCLRPAMLPVLAACTSSFYTPHALRHLACLLLQLPHSADPQRGGKAGARWKTTPTNPLGFSYGTRPDAAMRTGKKKLCCFDTRSSFSTAKLVLLYTLLDVFRCSYIKSLVIQKEMTKDKTRVLGTVGWGRLAGKRVIRKGRKHTVN